MSVFRGSITEYPGVIADHFIPFNCARGRAFFLSHCHKDHMTGLGSEALLCTLKKRNTNLFCSEVTKVLLLKNPEFTSLGPYLKGLPMEDPVAMSFDSLPDSKALSFTVTLLPAGHCPGSVMFLFEGSRGAVLYTGDFRLSVEETKRIHSLHSCGSVKNLSSLYLDTTFCHPKVPEIPSRETTRDCVLKLIEKWLSASPQNVVHLQCSMFGYEHIFMGVAKMFNTKVHLARWRVNAYSEISAMDSCVTCDGNSTRIHSCAFRKGHNGPRFGLPCGFMKSNGKPQNVLRIKPSMQWFVGAKNLTKPYVFLPRQNMYRVMHSMHASYSEICQFVSYLKPQSIVPCVVSVGDKVLSDVHSRLRDLLPSSHASSATSASVSVCVDPIIQPSINSSTRTASEPSCSSVKHKGGGEGGGGGGGGRGEEGEGGGEGGWREGGGKEELFSIDQETSDSESDPDWRNDNIEEFSGSEDLSDVLTCTRKPALQPLASSPLPKHLALPSTLLASHKPAASRLCKVKAAPPASTQHATSGKDSRLLEGEGEEGGRREDKLAEEKEEEEEEEASESPTLGTLEQTPLELSFSSSVTSEPSAADIDSACHRLQSSQEDLPDRPSSRGASGRKRDRHSSPAEGVCIAEEAEERCCPGKHHLSAAEHHSGKHCTTEEVASETSERELALPLAKRPRPCSSPVCKAAVSPVGGGGKGLRRELLTARNLFVSLNQQVGGDTRAATVEEHSVDITPLYSPEVSFIDLTHDDEEESDEEGKEEGEETGELLLTDDLVVSDAEPEVLTVRRGEEAEVIELLSSSSSSSSSSESHSTLLGSGYGVGTVGATCESYSSSSSSLSRLSSIHSGFNGDVENDFLVDDVHDDDDDASVASVCSGPGALLEVLGSPSFLPPTPGREGVDSILQRRAVGFSQPLSPPCPLENNNP